jgi:hypothetical protein
MAKCIPRHRPYRGRSAHDRRGPAGSIGSDGTRCRLESSDLVGALPNDCRLLGATLGPYGIVGFGLVGRMLQDSFSALLSACAFRSFAFGTAFVLAACGGSSHGASEGDAARGGGAGTSGLSAGGRGAAGQGAAGQGAAGQSGHGGVAGAGGASSAGSSTGGKTAGGRGGQGELNGGAGAATSGGGEAGGDEGGAGGVSACSEFESKKSSLRARSAGFSGTSDAYDALFVDCNVEADCEAPCLANGGTAEMCAAGECVMSLSNYCVPAAIWSNLDALDTAGADPLTDGAELVLVSDSYQDTLLLDDFGFQIPADAELLGFTVTVRHAGGSANDAVDASIQLLKDGVPSSADRASPVPWSAPDFVDVDYGGPRDRWGAGFTPAAVNAEGFGVALSAKFGQSAGNGRAYVDIVYVTVSYRLCP